MMQDAVEQLMQLGPFFEMEIAFELVKAYEDSIVAIQRPVTNEEAIARCHIFQDYAGFHELEWSLMTAIESVSDWPIKTSLIDANNKWLDYSERGREMQVSMYEHLAFTTLLREELDRAAGLVALA